MPKVALEDIPDLGRTSAPAWTGRVPSLECTRCGSSLAGRAPPSSTLVGGTNGKGCGELSDEPMPKTARQGEAPAGPCGAVAQPAGKGAPEPPPCEFAAGAERAYPAGGLLKRSVVLKPAERGASSLGARL